MSDEEGATATGGTPSALDARHPTASSKLYFIMVAALVLMVLPVSASAHVGPEASYGWVWMGGDKVYNFDHKDKDDIWNNDKVDWPVHLVFWNDAEVDWVKTDGHRLDNDVFKTSGGSKWLRLRGDNNAWMNDSDRGRKKFNCKPAVGPENEWTQHYRVYADGNDRLWTPDLGFFVIATAHFDFDDPASRFTACDDAQFGFDEIAEGWIVWYYGISNQGPQWPFDEDCCFIFNDQDHVDFGQLPNGNGDPHTRDSDGRYSKIMVPNH